MAMAMTCYDLATKPSTLLPRRPISLGCVEIFHQRVQARGDQWVAGRARVVFVGPNHWTHRTSPEIELPFVRRWWL